MMADEGNSQPAAQPFAEKLRSTTRSLFWIRFRERFIFAGLSLSAIFSVLVTIAIILVLVTESINFFRFPEISLIDFLFYPEWTAGLGEEIHYGILPLISGTMLVTVIAMLIAIPLGLTTAVYLSEYASPRVRNLLKPTLEILAGIPTVVYGYLGLVLLTPILRSMDSNFDVFNALSGGIMVGILCLPTVCSLAEDALRAVPQPLRDASYGLGGTRFDTTVKVVFPAALSGIISACLLAFSRAIGETMVVTICCGNTPSLTPDPRSSIQTMTASMTQAVLGDISNFGPRYYSMYAVALTLFIITLVITCIGTIVRRRYREIY